MDYEKKYNEALERARALWLEAIEKEYPNDYLKDYETIFPELAESEDERIRRTLVEYFGPKVQLDFVRGIPIQKIRDWLEKQKEQKQTDLPAGFYYIDLNGNRYYSKEFRYGDMKLKVGEQKPLETPSPSVIYTEQGDVLAEQEPAWSEEDNEMYINVASSLRGYSCGLENEEHKRHIKRELDWLENRFKSLRPQPREEIYQSAKHDLAIKFMNYLDENRPEGKMSLSNGECEDIDKAFKENDWAKIMRYVEKYRPSWKPSEEQMEALQHAIDACESEWAYQDDELRSLLNDLKKL